MLDGGGGGTPLLLAPTPIVNPWVACICPLPSLAFVMTRAQRVLAGPVTVRAMTLARAQRTPVACWAQTAPTVDHLAVRA